MIAIAISSAPNAGREIRDVSFPPSLPSGVVTLVPRAALPEASAGEAVCLIYMITSCKYGGIVDAKPRPDNTGGTAMSSEQDELQTSVTADARLIYSETVIDHAVNPRNLGGMADFDGFARVTGSCGDTMEIWLKVKENTIADISFMTDGCGPSIASGSMVTELATGKSVIEAVRISRHDVINALGGLPEESQHCALLAANTLKMAIRDYLAMKREPWKKAYRVY
jgi:nitrogen fixation NifU-like protein